MEFGNASWGFRKLPLEEQLRITHGLGLELLELGIANAEGDLPLCAGRKELENVQKLYEKYKVKLLYGATGNDFTTGERKDVEKVKGAVDVCEKLGIKYLRIFAGFSPVEEVTGQRWDNMMSCIRESDDYAQNHGVFLAIETHGGVKAFEDGVEHFMSTSVKPDVLFKMLEELPKTVKLNFDPANLWAVGIKRPEEIYKVCKDRVVMVHLKDFVKLSTGHIRPAACGDGEMNWKAVLRALADYKGAALFEYENTEDVEEGSAKCFKYITEMMGKMLLKAEREK